MTTIAMGLCASTATVLLAAGAKGKRFAMPSARIMMHQPAGERCHCFCQKQDEVMLAHITFLSRGSKAIAFSSDIVLSVCELSSLRRLQAAPWAQLMRSTSRLQSLIAP